MEQRVARAVRWGTTVSGVLAGILLMSISGWAHRPQVASIAPADEPRGWLVIEGGSCQ